MSVSAAFMALPRSFEIARRPRNTSSAYLRTEDMPYAIGVSRPTFFRLRAKGLFPEPDFRWGRAVGWLPSTIEKYLEAGGPNG